ncbi:MAG TPA: putative toxin-antitoxin system toxin component, PIN family [Thermoanaerobaculia bacterium]|nr:putative toxin-antitoxin system toxin component, PIN family [Thermoanaerobaculia bacterium]
MRAVVDTNILIRALLKPQGTVAPILGRLRAGDYLLLYSTETLEEIADVLSRPRFRNKYGIRDRDVEALLALLILRGEKVAPSQRIAACRDPKDDKFLEVAVAGQAEILVTGDRDLLVLSPFQGIPFLTPAEFLNRLD